MKRFLVLTIIALAASLAALGQEAAKAGESYSVPDINGRAVMLVRPDLPGDVIIEEDGKTIIVMVVVNANGDVTSAKCSLNCPKAAVGPAETAARASKFRPLIVAGQAVKYDGTLIYTITAQKVNWYRFAVALQSTFIFDNLSLGPVAAMLTNEYSAERVKLQELDARRDLQFRWDTIKGVRESVGAKLQGPDHWWFDLGFAMRDVTAPFQSDRRLDLNEVQTALSDLGKFHASAPADVPPATLEMLKKMAEYKIGPEMTPQEVHEAISKLAYRIRP